jgi:hypothetical protein
MPKLSENLPLIIVLAESWSRPSIIWILIIVVVELTKGRWWLLWKRQQWSYVRIQIVILLKILVEIRKLLIWKRLLVWIEIRAVHEWLNGMCLSWRRLPNIWVEFAIKTHHDDLLRN